MDIRKFFAKPAGAAKPAEAKVAVEKDPTPKKAKAPVTKAANGARTLDGSDLIRSRVYLAKAGPHPEF